jgi:hypothetical protein
MTNHYHLLVKFPDDTVSKAMHHLGSVYTHHSNERCGRDGPLFRGRFRSIPVTSDAYVLLAARYINRNPLDLVGVDSPDQYRWSSYLAHLSRRRPPGFLDRELLLDFFGGDRTRLAAFTNDEIDGSPRAAAHVADPATLDSLIELAAVHEAFAERVDDPSRRIARVVRLLVLDHPIDPRLREAIESQLRFGSTAARQTAESRARARLAAEPSLGRILDAVVPTVVGRRRAA